MSDQPTWRERKFFGRPWQDLLFALGEVVFIATTLPLITDPTSHVPALTGIGTAVMLYGFMVAHISYRNWITVVLTAITATIWLLTGLGVNLG